MENLTPISTTWLVSDVFLGSNSSYTVTATEKKLILIFRITLLKNLSDADRDDKMSFITPAMPFKIRELVPGMPAAKAGIKAGDKIVSINGTPIRYYNELQETLPKLKGQEAKIVIERAGQQQDINLKVSPDGTIGLYPESLLTFTTIKFTLGQAISEGTKNAFNVVFNNIKGFGKIFRGEVSASKALSGPIGIARMFGGVWDWNRFWHLTGLLSMVLAFMNALPIPALDGGHAVILSYEIISGRKPSDVFLENAQKVGMVLLTWINGFRHFQRRLESCFLEKYFPGPAYICKPVQAINYPHLLTSLH